MPLPTRPSTWPPPPRPRGKSERESERVGERENEADGRGCAGAGVRVRDAFAMEEGAVLQVKPLDPRTGFAS